MAAVHCLITQTRATDMMGAKRRKANGGPRGYSVEHRHPQERQRESCRTSQTRLGRRPDPSSPYSLRSVMQAHHARRPLAPRHLLKFLLAAPPARQSQLRHQCTAANLQLLRTLSPYGCSTARGCTRTDDVSFTTSTNRPMPTDGYRPAARTRQGRRNAGRSEKEATTPNDRERDLPNLADMPLITITTTKRMLDQRCRSGCRCCCHIVCPAVCLDNSCSHPARPAPAYAHPTRAGEALRRALG